MKHGNEHLLDSRELATVLAALRYYQERGLADEPSLRSDGIHDIATSGEADLYGSLTDDEIDALCERLNLGDTLLRKPATPADETEPGTPGRLYAPNGKRVVAAMDMVPGNAEIAHATRLPDGKFDIEWTGNTRMCWDGQFTDELDGERLFLDEAGNPWTENELVLKPEGSHDAGGCHG